MLSCRELTAIASNYVDRALSGRQRLRVWLHLWKCHHCRRYLRQLRALVGALRRWPGRDLSEAEVDRQVEKLKRIS